MDPPDRAGLAQLARDTTYMTAWLSCATVNHSFQEKYLARSRISFKSSARSQKSVVHAGHQITVFVKSIGRGDRLRSIIGRGDQILSTICPLVPGGERIVPSPVGTGEGGNAG